MSSDSARSLVIPLVAIAAVAVGVYVGNSLSAHRDSPQAAHPDAIQSDALVSAMRALTDELARARHDDGALTNSAVRTVAIPAQADDVAHEIREATKQLAAALDLLRTTATKVGGEGGPLMPPASPPDAALLDSFTPDDVATQGKGYQMWTYQQVMDRFGEPESIKKNSLGIEWFYRSVSGKWVTFRFTDGRAYEVLCEDPR